MDLTFLHLLTILKGSCNAITGLILTNKTVQQNTQTKYN